ncbi:MAG: bifunctional phosphopantothenoylcysteine decarboxylase/phosphopantothenate--cysteine ligase CoaBC [Desulfobulbaceae bacterium]|nr:bifunctional phosphopantothenoylcysteine decarboxylase/phosphopantothenate--cysteine ligase CoaBC [Desulfobulbaceae bacterium]
MLLTDKKIILGISGSIAVYKVADWIRALRRAGAEVQVVMTEAAARFVAPLTFAALSGNKVYEGMFDPNDAEQIPHINLAAGADLILIAPATAQTIARLAHGMADDLLSALVLANKSPVILCPAMNSNMYLNSATQNNLAQVREYGYRVVDPDSGSLACNTEGPGRLVDWSSAKEVIYSALSQQDLAGRKVLITAGPTREPLDPVRYLGNRSTGRMGFALATTAKRRGADVTLIAGPVTLPDPPGINVIRINTADEMAGEVLDRSQDMTVVVKAAAVSDFRPATYSANKLKKATAKSTLDLTSNQDILKTLGKKKLEGANPILVGFAAESHDFIKEGWRKLRDKNIDLLALNDITADDAGFAVETNRITLLDQDGTEEKFPLLSKEETADLIWNRVVDLLNK